MLVCRAVLATNGEALGRSLPHGRSDMKFLNNNSDKQIAKLRVMGGALTRATLVVYVIMVAWVSASAQTPLAGYRDFSYGSTSNSAPTGEKPESKLWFNDGVWWGSLYNSSAQAYHIYRLNSGTQSWTDTGTQIDDRNGTKGDALWDSASDKLYVVSHIFATSGSSTTDPRTWGRLYRFSYNSSTQSYSLDSGFPVTVTQGNSESLVVAKDTSGMLWVTYNQSGHVMVNHSVGVPPSDNVWATPIRLPVTTSSTNNLNSDDICSIIAFGLGKIGVFWSNQSTKKDYFIVHTDGASATSWATEETALAISNGADDHMNLKTDNNGRVFAAVKTSQSSSGSPLVMLLVRSSGGTWSNTTFGNVSDNHTRPIVLLDLPDNRLYIFATTPDAGTPQSIYYKVTSLSAISFPPGPGAPILQGTTDVNINNPASTKQNVDVSTGVVVLGSDNKTLRYLHNTLTLGAGAQPTITSFSPTAGPQGTQVTISGTNLDAATTFAFDGRVAQVISTSSTEAVVAVPSGASSGHITASTQVGMVATSSTNFTFTTSTTAAPTFSPAAGTYTSAQSVTLSDATSGATIHYTTNGSTPTASSAVYTSPLPVSATTTIMAMATSSTLANSPVSSATYTINLVSQVATPSFSPSAGTYSTVQSVTITDATSGATIFYTTDGSTPTTSSAVYTSPIPVSTTTTIMAMATSSNLANSPVSSATYTINLAQVATPSFSPPAGTYSTAQSVTITDATASASIFYTVDGSVPTTSSMPYAGPISVPFTETIKAIASASGMQDSAIASAKYTINTATLAIDYSGGFTAGGLQMNGSAALSSNRLRITPALGAQQGSAFFSSAVNIQSFTTDFDFQITQPTADGFTFTIQGSGPTAIGGTGQALGYGSSNTPSIKNSMAIKFDLFSNAGEGPDSTGIFTNGARPTVPSIDLTGTGIDLHNGDVYTVHMTYDGAVLRMVISDETNPVVVPYTLAFDVNIPSLVGGSSAWAGFTGATGSKLAVQDVLDWSLSAGGSVTPTVATPTFNPPAGSYTSAQTVTLSDDTSGSTIYYTVDGTTPTLNSTQYTGPISVTTTTTVKAMAVATGMQSSGVATATYTLL